METRICPFNTYPCIKEKCAMFLKSDSVTIDGTKFDQDAMKQFFSFPCAVYLAGLKAALDLIQLQLNPPTAA